MSTHDDILKVNPKFKACHYCKPNIELHIGLPCSKPDHHNEFSCTREFGHKGPHVACTPNEHRYVMWNDLGQDEIARRLEAEQKQELRFKESAKAIPRYRVLALRQALKLEIKGMRKRGMSALTIVKHEFGFVGTREQVLDQLERFISRFTISAQKESTNDTIIH